MNENQINHLNFFFFSLYEIFVYYLRHYHHRIQYFRQSLDAHDREKRGHRNAAEHGGDAPVGETDFHPGGMDDLPPRPGRGSCPGRRFHPCTAKNRFHQDAREFRHGRLSRYPTMERPDPDGHQRRRHRLSHRPASCLVRIAETQSIRRKPSSLKTASRIRN